MATVTIVGFHCEPLNRPMVMGNGNDTTPIRGSLPIVITIVRGTNGNGSMTGARHFHCHCGSPGVGACLVAREQPAGGHLKNGGVVHPSQCRGEADALDGGWPDAGTTLQQAGKGHGGEGEMGGGGHGHETSFLLLSVGLSDGHRNEEGLRAGGVEEALQ